MKTLTNLLEKYKNIQAPNATVKKTFITVVEEMLDIELEPSQIKVTNKTIVLSTPSVVKSEIRLHQKDILDKLTTELGTKEVIHAIL